MPKRITHHLLLASRIFIAGCSPTKSSKSEKQNILSVKEILWQKFNNQHNFNFMFKLRLNQLLFLVAVILLSSSYQKATAQTENGITSMRAPAYPLITIDPYTCAWSMTDHLFDSPVRHWTGRTHSLIGAIRVDGNVYRFWGKEDIPLKTILPMGKEEMWDGKYTTSTPKSGWEQNAFNDRQWKSGKGAFGTQGIQATSTVWETKEIWVRREFTLPEISNDAPIYLIYSHDDDFELYLNGKEIINTGNHAKSDIILKIDTNLLNINGKNVIAAHCLDRGGLAYVDFGIVTESNQKEVFAQAAIQNKVALSATQTHYNFTCGPIDLSLKFVSPLLPDDLDLLSRPVNYINYEVVSNDGRTHDVQVYFETTPEWAINEPVQEVEVTKGQTAGVNYLKAGTTEQPVLEKKGDNIRIDWGYVYLASNQKGNSTLSIGEYFDAKKGFIQNGAVKSKMKFTVKPSSNMPAMVCVDQLGSVSSQTSQGLCHASL